MPQLSKPNSIGLLVCISLILSIPSLWVPFYNIDELTNAIHAAFILNGELDMQFFIGNTYLLTHYLYAWIGAVFGFDSLVPYHITHALWKCGTILACYWAGTHLADRKVGLWSAVFYTFGSLCFMSKDFHTPSAESFSLLPAILSAGFIFKAMKTKSLAAYFLAGACAALATLFKAPMGVTWFALLYLILIRREAILKYSFVLSCGFALTSLSQILFLESPIEGIKLVLEALDQKNSEYILSYSGLSTFYWFTKFLIRSLLVFGSLFGLSCFAVYSLRALFRLRKKHIAHWQKIHFLLVWFLLLLFVVTLGKRIFYHYYVFVLAPLVLMAGLGLKDFDTRQLQTGFLKGVRRYILVVLLVPALGFSIEGAFNYSTKPADVSAIVDHIRQTTKTDERIYVWGNLPQIYFNSQRLPSTPHFWSDLLAGTTPGSPAMEYVRATGEKLTLTQLLRKDFNPQVFDQKDNVKTVQSNSLFGLAENELFTFEELLEKIEHPYWQKVMADFFSRPPVLFIDTSPTNLRGFGHFPITKYPLLKRFIQDNYVLDTKVNSMIVYRLKTPL